MSGAGVAILWLASNPGSSGTGGGAGTAGKLTGSAAADNAGGSDPRADGAGNASSGAKAVACGKGDGALPEFVTDSVSGGVSGSPRASAGAAFPEVSAGEDTSGTARLCRSMTPKPIAARLTREAPARLPMATPKSIGRKRPSGRRGIGATCAPASGARGESKTGRTLATLFRCPLSDMLSRRDALWSGAIGRWLSGGSASAPATTRSRFSARCGSFARCQRIFLGWVRAAAGTGGARSAERPRSCCRTANSRWARATTRRTWGRQSTAG